MQPQSAVALKLHKKAQGLALSHQEESRGVDSMTFIGDIDDLLIQKSEEASRESPGAKALRELDLLNQKYPAQVTPTKHSAKVLERPYSSGDDAVAPLQYQMPAAVFRPAQLKRPNVLSPSLNAVRPPISASMDIAEPFQSEVSAGRLEIEPMKKVPISTLADPSGAEPSKKHLARPATYEKDTTDGSGQAKGFWQASEREESTQFECHPTKLVAQPDSQDLADVKQRQFNFNFAPAMPSSENLPAATPPPLMRPEPSAQIVHVSAVSPPRDINKKQPETVLPSIEVDGAGHDDTVLEQPSQRVVRHEAITPKRKSNTHMQPYAPRARRQTSVLEGEISRRPWSNMRARKPTPQRHSRPADAEASQPTEEDIYYLLMSRSREANNRERALEATQKRLRAQLRRLHEQNWTFHQQLTAADARLARQNAGITDYQAQISDFKSRFTKFKTYARDLAQDYTDMGKAMKHIGNTTNELINDRADINRGLESLRQLSASTSALLVGLRPKISAAALEISPIQHALQLAQEKVQMTDASLQHERLRNNRIETQMLRSQQVQERLSLSSMQEYRHAAGYLDDLCHAIIQLSTTVTKKLPFRDSPTVVECLSLLQALAEKQGTSTTTLMEMKAVVGTISERLLSYRTSAEKATMTATSQAKKLSYDVICQITSSLGGLGPSIGTEVNFATLRERAANLQKQVNMGAQMLNLAHDGRNESEQREKEQSIRFDNILQQLAEANKRRDPTIFNIASLEPGLDVGFVLTKCMQAGASLATEQLKVSQKNGEPHNKSTDILALNRKLQTLRNGFEASQASLAVFHGQDQRLRGQADAVVQENIALKEQLEKLESSSLQATRIPRLVNDLAAKDAELAQLRPQAVKVDELAQILTGKYAELKQLRPEAAEVPLLIEDLNAKDTELNRQRFEAAKVPKLDHELFKLRGKAATMSQLEEKVALTEARLKEWRLKADQFEAKNALNILSQSRIHDNQNATKLLEQQLAGQNTQLAHPGAQQRPVKRTAAEETELQKQNTAPQTQVPSLKQDIRSLENDLNGSRRSTQEVETLQKEIIALKFDLGKYDQLKRFFTAQKDAHTKYLAHVAGLQSKLDEAQARCSQVPNLQGQLEELAQKCDNLNQLLSEATKASEGCQTLQEEIEQKADDIILLKSKLKNFEEASHHPLAARGESRQKSRQLTASGEEISKLPELQRLPDLEKPEIQPPEKTGSGQQTMADLRDRTLREELAHESDRLQSDPFAVLQDAPQHEKADRSSTTTGKSVLARKTHHEAKTPTKDTNSTSEIPDSPPRISSLVVSSSPLSELENTSYFGRQDVCGGHPPSSSFGVDPMLLEDFEVVEGMLKESRVDSSADVALSQRKSHESVGYGDASSRTLVADQGTRLSSRLRSVLSSRVVQESEAQERRPSRLNIVPSSRTIVAHQGSHLSSRRLRSKTSSQVIEGAPSQEPPSTPMASSSPAGPLKHLPNSGVKRPRLESMEAAPKRLKRAPADLEVRTKSNPPTSSDTQTTEPDSARPTRLGLPSGSPKGSVTGANARAPGKRRGVRKTSKGTKSERYAERFSDK